MKKYPNHFNHYLLIARDLGLSCPEGRALYICNRIQNRGWSYPGDGRKLRNIQGTSQEMYERIRAIRPSTAERWREHWQNGGSIKALRSKKKKAVDFWAC